MSCVDSLLLDSRGCRNRIQLALTLKTSAIEWRIETGIASMHRLKPYS